MNALNIPNLINSSEIILAKKLVKKINPISLTSMLLDLNSTKHKIATTADRIVWV